MTNKKILLAILVIALVFGTITCGDNSAGGSGSGSNIQQETETPLQFKGKTADGDEIIIEISRTAIKAVITPKDGDYYVIKKNGAVISSGIIKINGSSVTFIPNSGASFEGSLDTYNVTLVINIPEIGNITMASGGEGKSVTITGLPPYFSTVKGNTNLIGVFLFNELYGQYTDNEYLTPFNTAIQYATYNTTTAPVFNLVVPRDNTWNGTNGKSQPRWNGNGDYYVIITPVINNEFSHSEDLIYTDNTGTPLKVTFNDNNPDQTLEYSEFKKVEFNMMAGIRNTLTITSINNSSVFTGTPPFNAITAIVPVGTNVADVEMNLVAWCFTTGITDITNTDRNIPLFKSGNNILWNGRGTFDVYYGSYTGTWGNASFEIKTMFQASSVNFNSANTTVAWSSFINVMP